MLGELFLAVTKVEKLEEKGFLAVELADLQASRQIWQTSAHLGILDQT